MPSSPSTPTRKNKPPTRQMAPESAKRGPALFSISVNDQDGGVECATSEFADDAKQLGGAVGSFEGQEAWRRDRDRWEHQAIISGVKWNKRQILHLGGSNAGRKSKRGEERLESNPVERDLGVLVGRRSRGAGSVARHQEGIKHSMTWEGGKACPPRNG